MFIGILVFIVMAAAFVNPSPSVAALSILHTFSGSEDDGSSPWGDLTLSGSTFYGMTAMGGASGNGAVFTINTDGTGFKLLYSFTGGADGDAPTGNVTISGSTLYGMTVGDSAFGTGPATLFKINDDGTEFKVLHAFGTGKDGADPQGSLTLSGSTLFGMTWEGGTGGNGTLFKISTTGAGYKILHDFGIKGGDGGNPMGSLTLSGSTLYGMTQGGGTRDEGTIFKMSTSGAGYTVLHSFSGSDGQGPIGNLTVSGTTLYGMTNFGGADSLGTIFAFNTKTGKLTLLHSFSGGNDGRNPTGSLTLSGTTLYGMTGWGGTDEGGTIFQIQTDGTGYQVLQSLSGKDGVQPYGSFTLSGSTLYGMTGSGGGKNNNGDGTIFSLPITPAQ
jgi:uncharacterized repeat protein (TIGR03803 family)